MSSLQGQARGPALGDDALMTDVILALVTLVLLGAVSYLLVFDPTSRGGQASGEVTIARLTSALNVVQNRPSRTLLWRNAQANDGFAAGESVFVGERSLGVITFEDGSVLQLEPNSLVVLVPPAPAEQPGQPQAPPTVQLLAGRVSGQAKGQDMRIQVGEKVAKLSQGGDAVVQMGEDKRVRVEVRSGEAAIESALLGPKESVRIGSQQAGESAPDGGATRVETLDIGLVEPLADERWFATTLPASVRFVWNASGDGAPGRQFVLVLARDPFMKDVVQRAEVRGNSRGVTGLGVGQYYWTVSSGESSSMVGAFTVVPAVPPVPLHPRTDDLVDQVRSPGVRFAWSPAYGVSRVHLELARDQGFAQKVVDETVDGDSFVFVDPLPEGAYFWRVRAAEPASAAYSRSVRFRIVNGRVLEAPNVNDDVEIEIEAPKGKQGWNLQFLIGGVAYAEQAPPAQARVTLRWDSLTDAVSYETQIATDKEFQSVVVTDKTKETWYVWRYVSTVGHFWRVRGVDRVGRPGKWSIPRTIEPLLTAPTASGPPAGARFLIAAELPEARLAWSAEALATHYEVELTREGYPPSHQKVAVPALKVTLEQAGRYEWRVRALSYKGDATAYTAARTFVVELQAPLIQAPKDGVALGPALGGEEGVPMRWRAPLTATRFLVEVARDAQFGEGTVRRTVATPRFTYVPEGKGTDGQHHVRVRAFDEVGLASPFSPTETFFYSGSPVTLLAPPPEAVFSRRGTPPPVELQWTPLPLAKTYRVEMGPDKALAGARFATTVPRHVLQDPPPGTHYWRVVATLAGGVEVRSALRSFSAVALPELVAPRLIEPRAGKRIIVQKGEMVPLRWQSDAPTAYELQVTPTQSFDAPDRLAMRVGQVNADVELKPGRYLWRVRSIDGPELGNYGDPEAFEVAYPPPASVDVAAQAVEAADVDGTLEVRVTLRDARGRPLEGRSVGVATTGDPEVRLTDDGGGVYRGNLQSDVELVSLVIREYDSDFMTMEEIFVGRWVVSLGAAVGLQYNFGELVSPRPEIEAQVRLPYLYGKFYGSLNIGYLQSSLNVDAFTVSRLYGIPITALATYRISPPGAFALYGGAGASLALIYNRTLSQYLDKPLSDFVWAAGPAVMVGSALSAFDAELFAEARYSFARIDREDLKAETGGIVATLGVRLPLWTVVP